MPKGVIFFLICFLCVGTTLAQTDTPTPTLPIPGDESIYTTLVPGEGTPEGQTARFDYAARAAGVQISNLLILIFVSLWGMFLFSIFMFFRSKAP